MPIAGNILPAVGLVKNSDPFASTPASTDRPLVESTLDSTSKALQDAGKTPDALDAILLVGGSTRTPFDLRVADRAHRSPPAPGSPPGSLRGARRVLASRLAGYAIERVRVDVSPYSFGVSYFGERGGVP